MSKQQSRDASGSAGDPLDLLGRWRIQLDPELLILALTHRSFAYEQGDLPHNERLEFLGDSVLSIIVTEHLFRKFPTCTEAQLSRMRGAIVSQVTLPKLGEASAWAILFCLERART